MGIKMGQIGTISQRPGAFPPHFYSRVLSVTLEGNELLLVKALADVFCTKPHLEDFHLIGASGQVMVSKAFNLEINGLTYFKGDGGTDYQGVRIDTKTSYSPTEGEHILWVPEDPDRWGSPKLFVGVTLRECSIDRLEGEIFGFATTSRIKELIRFKKVGYSSEKFKKIGIGAEYLFPISWLKLYLQCGAHVMSQFLSEKDLDELIQCIPPNSSTRAKDKSPILVSLFDLGGKESASEAI